MPSQRTSPITSTRPTTGFRSAWSAFSDETGYRAEADINRDGTIDIDDYNAVGTSYATAISGGLMSTDAVDNIVGYDGYHFNAETRQYHVRFRVYDPGLGRWIQRDPIGYYDSRNLFEYAVGNPLAHSDPYGLDSKCLKKCKDGCPLINTGKYYVGDWGQSGPIKARDPQCVARCEKVCTKPDPNVKPRGSVTWGDEFEVESGKTHLDFSISITGEDPACCEEFAVIQFVRSRVGLLWWSGWNIDDGRYLGGSEPSPAPPYYGRPVPMYPTGKGRFRFHDAPSSFRTRLFQYKVVVMCVEGSAAGHIYGIYEWTVGDSVFGVWHDVEHWPVFPENIPENLPPILQDR